MMHHFEWLLSASLVCQLGRGIPFREHHASSMLRECSNSTILPRRLQPTE
ncbi:hypothetical protein ABH945_001197 [Paraburkholderia sp. GAS333]